MVLADPLQSNVAYMLSQYLCKGWMLVFTHHFRYQVVYASHYRRGYRLTPQRQCRQHSRFESAHSGKGDCGGILVAHR